MGSFCKREGKIRKYPKGKSSSSSGKRQVSSSISVISCTNYVGSLFWGGSLLGNYRGNHKTTPRVYLVVCQNRGPQCKPQNALTVVFLIIGAPRKGHLFFGNPPKQFRVPKKCRVFQLQPFFDERPRHSHGDSKAELTIKILRVQHPDPYSNPPYIVSGRTARATVIRALQNCSYSEYEPFQDHHNFL